MGSSGPLVVNKALNPNVGYDPEKDFQPIGLYSSMPNVVTVSSKLLINTLPELTEYVRRNPNTPYSSVGNGSSQHLAGVFFEQLTGVKMQHVPYRITSQLQADLISGQVPLSFQLLPNVIGAIKGGQARPLAVASKTRLPALPNVPTAAEAGVKGYESAAWFGFVAPRGTPKGPVERLNREINAATADPAVRARMTDFGAEALSSTPEEFARFISAEVVKWKEIITKGNITLE
jgi:tripartite-type tricarboxylate transporter receptor subunit TctC